MITRRQVQSFYDRLGTVEDWWSILGDPAVDEIVRHGAFGDARSVFELGCGTGRLAERLLRRHLREDCRYLALDISATMVRLARRRLALWPGRALVIQADGAPRIPVADGAFDRFVATYVIEIFAREEAMAVLADAHRVLEPGGLACIAGLAEGQSPLSRLVCGAWNRVHRWRPELLGGCRPVELRAYLPPSQWTIRHHAVTVRLGVPCEAVVAERR